MVALQALRGINLIVAVTFVAEIGDVSRFDNPANSWDTSASCGQNLDNGHQSMR